MNWSFIETYTPLYIEALKVTLFISLWGVVFAFAVGLICATILEWRVPVLRWIVKGYIELSRGTPLLVQLFILYFAFPKIGIVWSAQTCAIVGLTFLGGSFMAETIRAGFGTVGKSQRESAQVLGFSAAQTMRLIVFPQAMSVSVPGIVANVVFLIKESSVVSGIALADLMFVTKDLIGMYYNTTEALLMLVVAYAIILFPLSIIGTLLERRLARGRL